MTWLAFGLMTRELTNGETVVGSGTDANWRIATADLGPRHFVLVVNGQSALVTPSSSDVVVVVNGVQLRDEPQALKDGDIISAGSGTFIYSDFAPHVAPPEPVHIPDAFLVDDAGCVAHPLRTRSTPIGRDAANTIIVRDATASRFHAEVRREAGGFALHTMGSAGTVLNGAPQKGPCLLDEGDTFEIAFAKFRFTRTDPGPDFVFAPAHSPLNDERSRKPTLGTGRSVVEADNLAERHSSGLKLAVALILLLVLVGVLWLNRGTL
jgi:pSer/pThr/pTyr-binding forkhead associated (FHA) protein